MNVLCLIISYQGEHEHRRVKSRYHRTSKVDATGQLVKLDVFDNEIDLKGKILHARGVDLLVEEEIRTRTASADVDTGNLDMHCVIGAEEKHRLRLSHWLSDNDTEPACEVSTIYQTTFEDTTHWLLQNFIPRLKNHCLARLHGMDVAEEDLTFDIEDREMLKIENDSIYSHSTAQFNFTTYDVRRDRDVVKALGDKCDIMLPSYEDDGVHPFWYARVIGIFHLNVTHIPTNDIKRRIEFLWVRWLGVDPEWTGGQEFDRLDRVGFVPYGGQDEPFGFVDPATVIRACHLVPAFEFGCTMDLLPQSKFRPKEGDFVNFYVNR